MKKRYLALIGLLWMMGSAAQTVTDKSLGFFTGKWDFKIWTADNQSEKPDLSATWTLEKGLDSAACFIGQVQHEGHIFTREMIVYHPAAHVYKRMVATGNGDYFILKTSGWNGNRLTWTGTQYSPGKKTLLKEEIEKLDSNTFKATFYTFENSTWYLMQTELLTRIN